MIYNLLNMKLLWVLTIFCSAVTLRTDISCPYEKAEYHSTSSLLAEFESGVNNWKSCASLCHGWYEPEQCVIWSFRPVSYRSSKTLCQLFGDYDGKLIYLVHMGVNGPLIHTDGFTGQVHCDSSSEEKVNEQER